MTTSERRETSIQGNTRPRVIVVGNLTIDDVVLPDGTTHMASVGGNSVYTAIGVRQWQPSVGLVTRRGEDFPREHMTALQAQGISTDGVVDIPGPTVRNWVVYEADGERHWIYRTPRERSREVAVQPADIPVQWLKREPPRAVHVTAMPLDAAEAIVDTVRAISPQAIITLDTHEDYVVDYRQRLRVLASKVFAFLPSRSEVADLVGYDDPHRALVNLSNLPTPIIVIKMGEQGALLWDKTRETMYEVGVVSGPVVDVTGAGDAFCGGFAAGLSLGYAPVESAQLGTLTASYMVAGFGSMQLTQSEPAQSQASMQSDPPMVRPISSTAARAQVEVTEADRGISSAVDIMREEIAMIPTLMAQQLEMLTDPLGTLASNLSATSIKHLYLTGCGDSAFAGAATALAFQKHAGVDAEGIHALDLARYRVRYLPKHSAVICISFSGKVGRTIEAAMQARRFGHHVLVLTGNADSPLAKEATDVTKLSVPTLRYSPGTSSYLAVLPALLNLAVAWGEASENASASTPSQLQMVPRRGTSTG